MYLSQQKYVKNLIQSVDLETIKPIKTPISYTSIFSKFEGEKLKDGSVYKNIVNAQ